MRYLLGGRSWDGFVVAPTGGYLETQTDWGISELWISWTNYPAPYWNEWHCIREIEKKLDGPFQVWWYGEWI